MRKALIAVLLVFFLLVGCITIGNCRGRAECYKKTAVYYALKADKKGALGWCRNIKSDEDINPVIAGLEYNNCIIEVAEALMDKKICDNVDEFPIAGIQDVPVIDIKGACEKAVQQEELKQQKLLNPKEAYKHTCPVFIFIFSILPLSVLFMRIYEK